MRAPKILPLLLVGVVAIGCDDDGTEPDDEEFVANLAPSAGISSSASGTAEFTVDDEDDVAYTLIVSNMTGVTAAHIHGPAGPGSSAGVIVPLFTTTTATGALGSNTILASAEFSTTGHASIDMDSLLVLMRNGNAYVNVHTTANPGGEIRGQIQRR